MKKGCTNLKGVLVLRGRIELISPASIGSGQDDNTNMDIILDAKGYPFIPASSFACILGHSLFPYFKNWGKVKEQNVFWGFSGEEGEGRVSAVSCSDLFLINKESEIIVRDGVAIDGSSGLAKAGAKYDYEIIERGAQFKLNLEIKVTEDNGFNLSEKVISVIRILLENGDVRIGRRTNSGLGRCKLIEAGIFKFDFNQKDDVFRWLTKDYSLEYSPSSKEEMPLPKNRFFSIQAEFIPKSSLIIRSYSSEITESDTVSLKSGSDFVIPGSSLRGALRKRAERILNTLSPDNKKNDNILDKLFGFQLKNNSENKENLQEKERKGKLRVEEVVLKPPNPDLHSQIVPEQQTRIKIDRFTGGTIEGALLENMALWSDGEPRPENKFCMEFFIQDFEEHEAGLMLLLLKDLWIGDLAVGGEKSVGRGVLQGQHAGISWSDGSITRKIKFDNPNDISDDDRKDLDAFVNRMNGELSGDPNE